MIDALLANDVFGKSYTDDDDFGPAPEVPEESTKFLAKNGVEYYQSSS
jgi:hypothetical protein